MPNKLTPSNRIAIVSLVLVIINILSTILLSLNQQNREQQFAATQQSQNQIFLDLQRQQDEEFRKQLIDLQTETGYANIVVRTYRSFTPELGQFAEVYMENKGAAIARNLRVVVCIEDVSKFWEDEITDINKFNFVVRPNALVFQLDYIKADCFNQNKIQRNALEVVVENLPPDGYLAIDILLSGDVSVKQKVANGSAYVIMPNLYALEDVRKSLNTYLIWDTLKLTSFYIEAFCENCRIEKLAEFVDLPALVDSNEVGVGLPKLIGKGSPILFPSDVENSVYQFNFTYTINTPVDFDGDLTYSVYLEPRLTESAAYYDFYQTFRERFGLP